MNPSFLAVTMAVAIAFGGAPTAGAAEVNGLGDRSTSELEHRLTLIDVELRELAQASLNSGVGPIGYRSRDYPDPDHPEWVQVDLGEDGPIDEIVLVPALWRSGQRGFVSDAFPAAFRILVGTADDPAGTVVAEFHDTAHLLPRVGPVVVPVPGRTGSWMRVEATRLSPRAFDGRYIFQLSELLVFSGEQNRALRRPVTASSTIGALFSWNRRCLVDGILPYVMNAAGGEHSLAFVSRIGIGDHPAMEIDLEEEMPVSGLRLHATDQSDTVPQTFGGDFGLPRHFQLEIARRPDFSDARVLLDVQLASIHETGPIMEWQFEGAAGRHVRLTALEPYLFEDFDYSGTQIGFAEIEVLSKGRNVALAKPVTAAFEAIHPARSLAALTDGRNLYGEILPLRQWLGELARRHDLETERPVVAAELAHRYARQKTTLTRLAWLAALLIAVIGFVIFYSRLRGMRKEAHIRERIAANLHDNLGANLHAIGLLGDLAKDAVDSPEELVDTVERIRSLTERTGSAARDCAHMLEARHVCEDLVAEMQRDSESLLSDLEHSFACEGEEFLHRLTRRKRIDLYLFYKESLANVIQHSDATVVETRLVADANRIHLTVSDNGHGLDGEVPASLKRRARLLGADIEVDQPSSGGTRVVLALKTRRFGVLK